MSLIKTVVELKKEVARRGAEFEAAKEREPALAAFASVDALVATLPMRGMSEQERHDVTMALVRENARKASPLWSSLLVIAYQPLLIALARKSSSIDEGDREQVVVEAFLDAVRAAGRHAYVRSGPGFIRRTTQMNVVHAIVTSHEDVEFVPFNEDKTLVDPRIIFENPLDEIIECRELVEIAAKHGVSEELAPAVALGRRAGRKISEVVAAAHPGATPDEQRRAYRRAIKARSRAKLKARLAKCAGEGAR